MVSRIWIAVKKLGHSKWPFITAIFHCSVSSNTVASYVSLNPVPHIIAEIFVSITFTQCLIIYVFSAVYGAHERP